MNLEPRFPKGNLSVNIVSLSDLIKLKHFIWTVFRVFAFLKPKNFHIKLLNNVKGKANNSR